MKKKMLTVAATALAATCLVWAQPPQGAKETVVIKEDAKTATVKKDTLPSPAAAPRPRVTRDPFVKGGSGTAPVATTPVQPPKVTSVATPGNAAGPTVIKPKEPPVEPPKVTVNGILMSGTGRQAIVVSPNNTFLVRVGQKLGDYRVSHIDRKQVVFTHKGKKFPIKLENEFAAKTK